MFKPLLAPLVLVLLAAGSAAAQAPAAEVQSLTKQLNRLMVDPKPEEPAEVLVSLADCGVRQTVRKYRSGDNPGALNISVSNSKNGSSWAAKSNDKVEFELNLGLEWSEIGAVSYSLVKAEAKDPAHYDLKLLRRPAAKGGSKSGIDSITLPLYTTSETEVAEVVRRLRAVQRQCTGQKG
ncbi:hypothetical protein [Hymenobacter jeollabukensis]|uniref:Uncharacterized protein n=1 Tax=Hymenobacter jeollabukensis TaxID=2025313 RepID=A0A5R8WTJ8_9BACT|nr:hypothetical protein [Hymenobacter jeollabukensis]TLM94127.1 hypothetical protein FDY95_08900 [Hymenobacter jeollabukensis]